MLRPAATLDETLEGSAHHPDGVLHFPEPDVWLTLERVAERADRIAAGLHELGIQNGLVAILAPTTPDFPPVFYGVLQCGAVPSVFPPPPPLRDPGDHARRLRPTLAAHEIDVLIGPRDMVVLLDPHLPGIRTVAQEALLASTAPAPHAKLCPDDLALVQFTSGSTASPKGVALTHANLLAGIRSITRCAGLHRDDVNGQWLPLYHDMGLISLLVGVWHGGTQHLWRPESFIKDPVSWLRGFADHQASLYAGPDFSYAYLAAAVDEETAAGLDLSAWRVAFNGAERIEPENIEAFLARFTPSGFRPEALFPVYGMAEVTLAISFPALGQPPQIDWINRHALARGGKVTRVDRADPEARGIVCVGEPVDGIELRIRGDEGEELGPDLVGEIEVRGASVTGGYYRHREATHAAFSHGWLRTGDLGYRSCDGLFLTGRSKQMIVVSGVNYYAEDVDVAVRSDPEIFRRRCAAVAWEQDDRDCLAILIETEQMSDIRYGVLADRLLAKVRRELGLDRAVVCPLQPRSLSFTSSLKLRRLHVADQLRRGELDTRMWCRPIDAHAAASRSDPRRETREAG